MRISKNKSVISILSLILSVFLIEIIFRFCNHLKVLSFNSLRMLLIISIIFIIVGFITSLFKPKTNYILNLIIVFIIAIYGWLQLGFYSFLGIFMSINSSGQFEAVKGFVFDFLKSVKFTYYLVFIPFICLLIFYFHLIKLYDYEKSFKLKKHHQYGKVITTIVILIVICLFNVLFYYSLDKRFEDDKYQVIPTKKLLFNTSNASLYIKQFGYVAYAIADFVPQSENAMDLEVMYALNNKEKEIESSRVFDDSAWQTLIFEEKNETKNSLNNYFINADISSKNEKTGIFENKNLIVILMESANDLFVNKEYFPNFYKMYNEGWSFDNNYSPRNSCATGNNEFSALTGLYSIHNICTANYYDRNGYPNAIFNLFNKKNYYTSGFHDYDDCFYTRSVYQPKMGAQDYYDIHSLHMNYIGTYGGWASDEELMNKYLETLDKKGITNENNFMSFITTVSSHNPYSSSTKYGDMYLDITEGTSLSMTIRRYYSKLKVLDNALGILIDGLKERGMFEDTVIIMFGDHYPYAISDNELEKVMTRDISGYEKEKVPLVIYNSEIDAHKYDTYTSYVNLTPTVANLFNLDFDPRLYAGVDIFSKEYNGVVSFADLSWRSKDAFYDASTGQITYFSDKTFTNEEIVGINSLIYAKNSSSTKAIKNNYFEYLDKSLTKIKERNSEETE